MPTFSRQIPVQACHARHRQSSASETGCAPLLSQAAKTTPSLKITRKMTAKVRAFLCVTKQAPARCPVRDSHSIAGHAAQVGRSRRFTRKSRLAAKQISANISPGHQAALALVQNSLCCIFKSHLPRDPAAIKQMLWAIPYPCTLAAGQKCQRFSQHMGWYFISTASPGTAVS